MAGRRNKTALVPEAPARHELVESKRFWIATAIGLAGLALAAAPFLLRSEAKPPAILAVPVTQPSNSPNSSLPDAQPSVVPIPFAPRPSPTAAGVRLDPKQIAARPKLRLRNSSSGRSRNKRSTAGYSEMASNGDWKAPLSNIQRASIQEFLTKPDRHLGPPNEQFNQYESPVYKDFVYSESDGWLIEEFKRRFGHKPSNLLLPHKVVKP